MEENKVINSNFLQPRDAWDRLSLAEKAEMMKVAVNNGIFNLQDIRDKYNEFAEGGGISDEEYYSTMEKVAKENNSRWNEFRIKEGMNPLSLDEEYMRILNDNSYNYRGFYNENPDAAANADTHWPDTYKTVWHPTFSNESIYSGQKSQYNPLGLPGGFWSGDTFIPMAWQIDANEYKKGGGIHIKPSHRGRLTELKKRTGKSEAELYRTGSPATRKMITFARNARHWKHGLGGNLYGGTSQPTQKMQKASDYRYVQAGKDNSWSMVDNDEMARVFQGFTATPNDSKQKFIPEIIDNSLEAAKAREKFFQYRDEEGHIKGEPGLEVISPEFDILMGARMAMPTYSQQAIKNYQIGRAMKLKPQNMPKVNKEFRSEEWGNFLNTRNGDNYYRIANIEKETAKNYSPKENYFVSHTTPWEEFSGMKGIEDPTMIGRNLPTFHNRLYEFPSKTFGARKSSSWEGVLGDTNVDVMGKNHLYYGDTSSGIRGPVRVISDTNADYLGISPYKIGITDRPLTINGLYDKTPVYEDIYMGNQTILNGKELQDAIQNSTYNIFDHTPLFFMDKNAAPSGITKTIHINK